MKATPITTILLTAILLLATGCGPTNPGDGASNSSSQEKPEQLNSFLLGYDGLSDPELQKKADYLAGKKDAYQSKSFAEHSTAFDRIWKKGEDLRLKQIRTWGRDEFAPLCKETATVFYPFGGADILHSALFFPCGRNTVMIGLEPPGTVADLSSMSEPARRRYLGAVRQSLFSIIEFSFFRTLAMRDDFANVLDGVAPVLVVFLARLDYELLAIREIRIVSDGKTVTRSAYESMKKEKPELSAVPGVQIFYRTESEGPVHSVAYFSTDISNGGLKETPYFLPAIKSAFSDPTIGYLKAASYLMHRDSFSDIRSFIMDETEFLLGDSSGIPIKYMKDGRWDLTYYGRYDQPINLFRVRHQPDLKADFRNKENDIRPLPFGIGYNYIKGTSHMVLGTKKASAPEAKE
ncbi:MAG: hypothetical protein CMN76_07805 [Spirochaetaceae bacterium]|nr:hypothetical protein [Spirochaetaceae bacterium]|tara:strand:- start:13135 stop:14352 length:1218 start_codon:yes stop_codon:yes gene_type:complete